MTSHYEPDSEREGHPFVPFREELRHVDLNGFCSKCHDVATSWGKLLAKVEVELADAREMLAEAKRDADGWCERATDAERAMSPAPVHREEGEGE